MTTLRTSVKESPVCIKNLTTALKCICIDSFTGVLRVVVVVIWTEQLHLGLPYAISTPCKSKTSHNHCLSSLSATRVTTLWLKQPTCFCSVHACMLVLRVVSVLWLWNELGSCLLDCMHYAISLQYQSNLSQPQSLLASFPGSPLIWKRG